MIKWIKKLFWKFDFWKFYQDKKGEYRWTRVSRNNEVVGASHEGFKSRQACKNNAKRAGYRG